MLLPLMSLFYFMPVLKMFYDNLEEQSIDVFPTMDKTIRFRFLKDSQCEFYIDLDIETAEALIDEIHLSLSKLEGGK